jgi:hypothetical protein
MQIAVTILEAVTMQERFSLRPNLAVLHWNWRIQGDRNEDMTPRKPRFGLFTMIVEKQSGKWLVVVAQNTNWIAGPNPGLNGIKPPIVFPTIEQGT